MKERYEKLNVYLNDICNYLQKEDSFLLDNINEIRILNDDFLQFMNKYYDSLDIEVVQNKLTFEEIYLLTREIIENIDSNYLKDFDNLIKTGELDFSYDNEYKDSHCNTEIKNGKLVRQLINVNREFNYNDVITLVHEFIHYTNTKKRSENVYLFTEFLSIYFEFYATDYLLSKGINKKEIDYFSRIKNIKESSIQFFNYEIVLLAFIKFGSIDENTIHFLRQYIMDIKPEVFERECQENYRVFSSIEKMNESEVKEDPQSLGKILCEPFISSDYRYILGTFLVFLARKYSKFEDIVYLNNHIGEYDNKSVYDICLSIGIDIKDNDFEINLFNSIIEYLKENNMKMKSS